MAKLLVQESGAEPREFDLMDAEVHIGRELDNALRIPDPSISRHHCVIRKAGTGYEIQDLQSSNGVLVNGSRVQASPLKHGDRITLGQIQITFMDPTGGEDATVAIQAVGAGNPAGTVRISAEQMAAIHAGGAPEPGKPSPAAPPVAPMPKPAPEFGQFTDPGQRPNPKPGVPMADQPAPGFLQKWLPPVPDDAQPTGQEAEIGDRILAHLIDILPVIAVAIVFWILSIAAVFIPFLGCLGCVLWLVFILADLAYAFYFLPQCVMKYGATPGKTRMKLRVVPEENPAGRLDFGRAILHQLGSYFGLIQLIVIAVNNGKGLSNIFAKSSVIKVNR